MKILFIRVSAIGDVVHTLPAVFLLKRICPNAQISWVVQKKAAELLKGQPFLQNVWEVPDKFWAARHLPEMMNIVRQVRMEKWDAIIDFQGILKTSLLLSVIPGPKYGFSYEHARSGPTSWLTDYHTAPDYVNIIQKNLALVSDVAANLCESTILPTIDELKKNINLEFPDSIKNVVDGWLISTGAQRLVIFAPNTTWPSKFWPMKNWQELLLKFDAEKSTDLSVALIGTSLGGQAAELGLFCSEKKLKTILVPKWDLLTVSYLITKSNLLVAPDTGLLHIADLLNVKTIGIFGPTSKLKHGPFLTKENIENAIQVNCPHFYQKTHGKNQKDSEKNNCMYKLSSDELFEKILRVLN